MVFGSGQDRDPPPAGTAPDTPPVGLSQDGNRTEPRHPPDPAAVPVRGQRGQRGRGRARGAPLGTVLTPRERALLRTAGPSPRSPAQQGQPPGQPGPPRGRQRELMETHERRVAEIRDRTRRLERQREGLCRQLEALGAGAAAGPQPEQGDLGLGPKDPAGQARAAQHRATFPLATLLPPAGPLAAEARALRLSYLRAGGHDPAILDQLLHLQLEATVLEKGTPGLHRGRRMGKPQPQPRPYLPAGTVTPQVVPEAPQAVPAEPPGTQGLDVALLAVELENWRLENELLTLKVRRERRANAGSWAAQQHSEELAQLQAEMGRLQCHTEQTEPQLHRSILPPPVAPQLPSALTVPKLFMESRRPVLGTGSSTPAHVPSSLPFSPFVALEDPPPPQEPPEQHKPPRR